MSKSLGKTRYHSRSRRWGVSKDGDSAALGHGPVKVIYSASGVQVADPMTWKGRLAQKYRQNPHHGERLLRDGLKLFEAYGIYFQSQVVVGGYILDFYCPARLLAIELDGPQHKGTKEYDRRRDFHLRRKGIKTVRYPIYRIQDMEGLLRDIAARVGVDLDAQTRNGA